MENFDLRKYLAEGRLLKEEYSSEYKEGDRVKFNPEKMMEFGFEDEMEYYNDLTGVVTKTFYSDIMGVGTPTDGLEIKLNKPIQPPGGADPSMTSITLVKSEDDFSMIAENKLLKEEIILDVELMMGLDADKIEGDKLPAGEFLDQFDEFWRTTGEEGGDSDFLVQGLENHVDAGVLTNEETEEVMDMFYSDVSLGPDMFENKLLKENEEYEEIIYHMNDIWRTDGDEYDSKEAMILDMKDNPEQYGVNLNIMGSDFDSYLEDWIASDAF